MQQLITEEILLKALSFEDYMALTKTIVADDNPQGIYQNPKTHRYTRSNLERMNKVLQNVTISQKLYNALSDLKQEWIWVVLSEPWCGDAGWGTPALYLIALCSDKIDFKILLRDEHKEIMRACQTEGSDSIPKLICIRKNNLEELGNWGPRPKVLQQIVLEGMKQPNFDYRESVRAIHAWYEADMTKIIQEEILDEVKKWKMK